MFYLVVIKENKPEEIIQLFKEKYEMKGVILMERKAGPELLKIIKFTQNSLKVSWKCLLSLRIKIYRVFSYSIFC